MNAGKRRYQRASRGKFLGSASLHAIQDTGERIPPNPTGAGLTCTAGPRTSDRLVPVRRISVIDRLTLQAPREFIGDAVFRLVKPRIGMRRRFIWTAWKRHGPAAVSDGPSNCRHGHPRPIQLRERPGWQT
jgi:hypothetical protein